MHGHQNETLGILKGEWGQFWPVCVYREIFGGWEEGANPEGQTTQTRSVPAVLDVQGEGHTRLGARVRLRIYFKGFNPGLCMHNGNI